LTQVTSPQGSTPVPDPTLLTTAALTREIAALKELVVTRLDAMDKAQALFDMNLNRVPTDTDKQIGHLKELVSGRFDTVDEKFHGIETQFTERDTRSERESKDNKVAVDAAFAAQKEAASEQNKSNTLAISKSETSTSETINKLAELFKTTTDALSANITDLKERITRIEGKSRGRDDVWGYVVGALGVIVAIVAVLAQHGTH
jgi:hypothetical protein